MRLSILSVLSLAGAGMVSALPQESNLSLKRSDSAETSKPDTSECVGPLLCCGTLTTPLDPVVDPLLLVLGIDAANIVGSIGLLCRPYDKSSCKTEPQCCTEVNLLGGTLALGCADLKK
ncbi:Hydrophobin [Penicillium griseofulvum]|uniref:Hydrophobin n=1 Tax=Penicillium patulum TaxID=5078 RepID=A0A135LT09_PENPA|nr:Hydrophobin [Penicillium griseofulvum]KXG52061.1 Hydrophobin [Penicillium griseofulvum]